MWMTGEITGGTFTPRASGRCDAGGRYYAPQSVSLTDGRRIGIGWIRESLDELTGQDRARVGVMSLPRELQLEDGKLRSRPARELDGARREKLASQVIEGRGTLGMKLSARDQHAAELHITPVRGETATIMVRLWGIGCADITIQVSHGRITINEENRPLTTENPAASPALLAALAASEVRIYYDAGIVEVYSAAASPAAVICDRDGRYETVELEILTVPGSPPSAVRITGWSSGQPGMRARRSAPPVSWQNY